MAGRKGKLIEISDLKLKINLLCEIFEKDILLTNISSQTLNNWRYEKRKSTETALNDFLKPLGIPKYIFELPIEQFSEYLADYLKKPQNQSNGYTSEDFQILLENLQRNKSSVDQEIPPEEQTRSFFLLKNTRNQINIKALEHDFERFKGFYWFYTYWATFEENRITKRFLQIYDIDRVNRVLKYRVAFPKENIYQTCEKWEYEGSIIKANRQLFFLNEANPESPFYPEIVTIHAKYPEYYYYENDDIVFYGIVTAISGAKNNPCTSRVVFRKIKKLPEKDAGSFFKPQEIESEDKGKEIVNWLNNQIDNTTNTLIADEPAFIKPN